MYVNILRPSGRRLVLKRIGVGTAARNTSQRPARCCAGDQLRIVIAIPAEVVVLPAASRAVAVSAYAPFATLRESQESVNLVIGASVVTSAPMFRSPSLNCTPATS